MATSDQRADFELRSREVVNGFEQKVSLSAREAEIVWKVLNQRRQLLLGELVPEEEDLQLKVWPAARTHIERAR